MTKEPDFAESNEVLNTELTTVAQLAASLTEKFPSLASLRGTTVVVKCGGAAMDDGAAVDRVCAEIAALRTLGIIVVVVHGGGKEISRWIERLGGEVRFIDGLRVTSEADMVVIEMVLTGRINADLVSRLSRLGLPAIGLSGRSGGLLQATPLRGRNGEDLGRAGAVSTVRLATLTPVLAAGLTPVISPVGESLSGEPLNLNADFASAAIAGALGATACIFLTDVEGVKRGGQLQSTLTPEQITEFIADGTLYGGMIPKVECARDALDHGCARAVITAAHAPLTISHALAQTPGRSTTVTGS